MAIFSRGNKWVMTLGLLGALSTGAVAQENLDAGKSGAQLFGANCAICHKLPDVLAKSGGVFGIESFLREHYTASRESAAIIAAYLKSAEKEPAPARRSSKRAKGDDKAKREKSETDKSRAGKSGAMKEVDSKTSENGGGENSKTKATKSEEPKSDQPKSDQLISEKASSPKQSGDAKPAQAD